MRIVPVVASLVAVALVAGCAVMPSGPNVLVLPGPQKSFDHFQADQASCQQYASATIGGASDAAANAAAANAVLGTALGAAAGAILGSVTGQAGAGAAWGAGTGLLFGSAAGSNAAGMTAYEAQRRYDNAYLQCMYARGNQVPGQVAYRAAPASTGAPAYPPPNFPPPNLQGNAPAPSGTSSSARIAAPRTLPPGSGAPAAVSSGSPASSGVPPGYGMPSGPIAPGPAIPVTPPGNYPPSAYPPPNTPPPPGYT